MHAKGGFEKRGSVLVENERDATQRAACSTTRRGKKRRNTMNSAVPFHSAHRLALYMVGHDLVDLLKELQVQVPVVVVHGEREKRTRATRAVAIL